jgi:hypothetical protein
MCMCLHVHVFHDVVVVFRIAWIAEAVMLLHRVEPLCLCMYSLKKKVGRISPVSPHGSVLSLSCFATSNGLQAPWNINVAWPYGGDSPPSPASRRVGLGQAGSLLYAFLCIRLPLHTRRDCGWATREHTAHSRAQQQQQHSTAHQSRAEQSRAQESTQHTAEHSRAQHNTAQHSTAQQQHSTAQHSTNATAQPMCRCPDSPRDGSGVRCLLAMRTCPGLPGS